MAQVVVVEVTNTLLSPYVTGYQRVVRELLRQLPEVVPLVCEDGYRRLTPQEQERLTAAPKPPPRGPRPLHQKVRSRLTRLWEQRQDRSHLAFDQWGADTVFLELEPAWHDPRPRSELLPELRARGVSIVTLVADVLPETHPEWFDPRVQALFSQWFRAHLEQSQLLLCISEATRADVLALAGPDGPPAELLPLGADFGGQAGTEEQVTLPAELGRFLLVVSTLEPRKNQGLALDVLDALAGSHPDLGLVLVGKQGWLVDDLVERIEGHPLLGRRLLWLTGVPDGQLTWLYRHAHLVLVPSVSEGLGLPAVEGLLHGAATITSTGGALPEAGAGLAELLPPDDPAAWVAAVRRHLDDPAHHAAARARAAGYRPPTWEAAAQALRSAVTRVS